MSKIGWAVPEQRRVCRAATWADNVPSALPIGLHIGELYVCVCGVGGHTRIELIKAGLIRSV